MSLRGTYEPWQKVSSHSQIPGKGETMRGRERVRVRERVRERRVPRPLLGFNTENVRYVTAEAEKER